MNSNEPSVPRGAEARVLSVEDVSEVLGCCERIAGQIIHETGQCISIHGRIYVFEDDFLAHLEKCKEA